MKFAFLFHAFAIAITVLSITACNPQDLEGLGSLPGSSPTPTPNAPSSSPTPTSSSTPAPTPVSTSSYPSCVSSDTSRTCIGLKIVSYQSSSGVTDVTEAGAVTLVNSMNTVWSQCNIAFQLEVYQSVDPTTLGLPYSPNWQSQTNAVRTAFEDNTRFVYAAVGPWTGATIAVTMMPGSGIYGSIVDQQYSNNPLTVAHELGHYEGLDDESSDTTNLMSLIIEPNAETLNASECAIAHSTNQQYWSAMMRTP